MLRTVQVGCEYVFDNNGGYGAVQRVMVTGIDGNGIVTYDLGQALGTRTFYDGRPDGRMSRQDFMQAFNEAKTNENVSGRM